VLQLQDTSAQRTPSAGPVRALLERLSASAAFAYGSILLLQLKMVWGIWKFKDLTPDDTAYYFTAAFDWYRHLQTLFTWSPLYTAVYGSFLHIAPDAYLATVAHRQVIVFVLAALVLYTMRRFLPPGLAWLMTVWWVVLPIDFDSKYEVHLFAVIPLLCIVLFALSASTWRLPAALAAFVATTVLVRNEYAIATVLFAVPVFVYEFRRLRGTSVYEKRRTLARYVGCLALVLAMSAFFLLRASDASKLRATASDKHTLNWCQVYTYGYQQRNTDFSGSPWSECQQLMERIFHAAQPSMLESLARNPAAFLEHVRWNISLLPNGLELLLFNVTAGSVTPDYNAAPVRPAAALVLTAGLIALLLSGWLLVRRNVSAWRDILQQQYWAWIAMLGMSVVAVFVMVTQRPRPSYLLALGIFIRIAAGVACWAILLRWPVPSIGRVAVPVAAAAAILIIPPYYEPGPRNRPLLRAYRRLQPFEEKLQARPVRLATRGWGQELCNYIVAGTKPCAAFTYQNLLAEVPDRGSLPGALDAHEINFFYIDDGIYPEAPIQQFVSGVPANGWKQIGAGQVDDNRWLLLARDLTPQTTRDIVQPGSGITLGRNWYPFERYKGAAFRWVNNDAEINLDRSINSSTLQLDLQPGPGAKDGKLALEIRDAAGAVRQRVTVEGRRTVQLDLGRSAPAQLLLHATNGGQPAGGDPRVLNFRVFAISTGSVSAPQAVKSDVAAPAAPSADIVSSADGIRIGEGWYPFETFGGQQFRWINNDAELMVEAGESSVALAIDVQPGPGAGGKPLKVRFVNDAGSTAASSDVSRLQTIDVRLPASSSGSTRYRIHIDGGGASIPSDPRILNLRVFRIRRTG
jgi:hypothetical protein